MTVHRLETTPPPDLGLALATFEAQFSYPLGPTSAFRISHGDDYCRFFRAIGRAACFVAEDRGEVLGTVAVVIRRLGRPDGSEQTAAYLADLKVAPRARGGRTVFRLAAAAQSWAAAMTDTAFSIVMDGTRATPPAYTGRVGIPAFREVAKVLVLRVPVEPSGRATGGWESDATRAERRFRELSHGRYGTIGGAPHQRSEAAPRWLLHPDGTACGLLEDTRRGKRLLASDGSELRSAHLSYFAFTTPRAGAQLVREARRLCVERGDPALFVPVAEPDGRSILVDLDDPATVVAPATIYGVNLETGKLWNVNTSEI